jgi:peptidoglycan hydrolase CwlO-like protein
MSKLQKFYGAQGVSERPPSGTVSTFSLQHSSLVSAGPSGRSVAGETAPDKTADNLGTILTALQQETARHLAELNGKIQTALSHQQQTYSEVRQLKKNLTDLRKKIQAKSGNLPTELEPILSRIDRNLEILAKIHLENSV